MDRMETGMKRIIVEAPGELHLKFKLATLREGTNMRKVLLTFVERYVKRVESKGPVKKKGG